MCKRTKTSVYNEKKVKVVDSYAERTMQKTVIKN